MKEQLQQRLRELKTEYETGQKMLAELEAKQASLRETLLRISGAIQVLEEELARADGRPPEVQVETPAPVAEQAGSGQP
jgi:predicted nuclease with TOPRIM domain